MKRILTAALTATAVLALGAADADAQRYRFDVGVNGGGSWFSTMLDEDHLGSATDQNIRYEPGWLVGGQAGFWFTPRIGLRANLAYTERPLQDADDPISVGTDLAEDINLWGISGDLMVRFREPNDRWIGTEWLPYVALGLGMQRTNPAANTQVTGPSDGEEGLIFGVGDQDFLLAEENAFMGLVGVGTDLRLSPRFAVRMELNDRIFDPNIYALNETDPGVFEFAEPGGEDIGNVTHQVSGQVGLHLLAGLQPPQQVVVAPPPPPAPAAPAPPPPPRVDEVTVCVVDPAAPGGLRMVNALYRHETRDTVVTEMGDTLSFATTTPATVTLAPSTTWYVEGQPLTLEFERAPRRVEYLTVGTSRVVPASDLAYLGNVNGVPVYASRNDVAEVSEQWNEALEARATGDMEDILEQNRELRDAFDDIEVLYVPVEPYGCVFQALQRQEEVRKGAR